MQRIAAWIILIAFSTQQIAQGYEPALLQSREELQAPTADPLSAADPSSGETDAGAQTDLDFLLANDASPLSSVVPDAGIDPPDLWDGRSEDQILPHDESRLLPDQDPIQGIDRDLELLPLGDDLGDRIDVSGGPTVDSPDDLLARAPTKDTDYDGDVDGFDFLRFSNCFTGEGIAYSDKSCRVHDYNRDGDVDPDDFAEFHACFNGSLNPPKSSGGVSCTPGQPAGTGDFTAQPAPEVPEPSPPEAAGRLAPAQGTSIEVDIKVHSDHPESSYDYERYSFEDALDLLRPDLASAVILEGITEADLKTLTELPFETALVVLYGELVLFTSGAEEELTVLVPALQLLKEAVFITHTHVLDGTEDGPSAFDLSHAVESPQKEYVITEQGAYAYNQSRFFNEGSPYSLKEYLGFLTEALDEARSAGGSQTAARARLNTFIRQMDRYNQAAEEEKRLFRLAESVSAFTDDFNRAGIGPDWTVETGNWSISNGQLNHSASTPAKGILTLNVPLGADDTDAQASFNFTSLYGGNHRGIVARFQDLNNFYYGQYARDAGRYRIFKVEGGAWTLLAEAPAPGVANKSYHTIRLTAEGSHLSLYFDGDLKVEADDAAFSTGKVGIYSGAYYHKVDDFSVTALGSAPPPTVTPPALNPYDARTKETSLLISGTKEADTSVWVNGIEAVPQDASAAWSYELPLTQEGDNLFTITAKDDEGNESGPLTVTIERDTQGPVLQIVTQIPEYTNASSLTLEYTKDGTTQFKTFTLTEGLNNLTLTDTDDLGNPSSVSFSVTLDTVLPTGTVTIEGGAETTDSVTVNLTLTQTEANPAQMQVSIDGGLSWGPWIDYASTDYQVMLPDGDGPKEVRVRFRDQAGNESTDVISDTVTLDTVPPAAEPGLIGYWDFDAVSGASTPDLSESGNTAALMNGPLPSTDHPANDPSNSGSLSFDGVNDFVSTSTSYTNPNVFTLSLWFKTTSTTGGKLIGFGNYQTGQSGAYDRHLYMDNSGKIYFGVYPGSVKTIASSDSYNDGEWHHAAASLSSEGMKLYLDGVLAASNAAVTSAQNYSGYWKIGYDNLNGWTQKPSSFYFKGLLDEARVYARALTEEEIVSLAGQSAPPDTTAPAGSITVDSGDLYTNSSAVTLTLSAADEPGGSGVTRMSFSEDGINWTPQEAFASTKTFSLSSGDGTKTVYVRYFDQAGNESQAYAASIVLDTSPPAIEVDPAFLPAGGEVSTEGLVSRLDIDNASGTTVPDLSGAGNEGILMNGTALTADRPDVSSASGQSLQFDGTNDYVDLGSGESLNLTTQITLALWAKTSGDSYFVTRTDSGHTVRQYNFANYPSQNGIFFWYPPGTQTYVKWAGEQLTDNAWHHLVLTINGTTAELFKDGVSRGARTLSQEITSQTANTWLGARPNGSGGSQFHFKGLMNDVRIYDRALSADEVVQLAQGTGPVSYPVVNSTSVTISYTLDGEPRTKTFNDLTEGLNTRTITDTDLAGNPADPVEVTVLVELPPAEPAGPTVVAGGVIASDTTWSKTGGPYIIEADVTVAQGTTLTIEAGTEVRFQKGASLVVDGALNAEGTETELIRFTSDEAAPQPDDWKGIFIRGAEASGSRISHWLVEYAWAGISLENTAPVLSHVTSSRNAYTGFYLGEGASPVMRFITASENRSTSPNYFGHGFQIESTASAVITDSTVAGNDVGFFLYSGALSAANVTVNRSSIYGNSNENVYAGYSLADSEVPVALDFRENWWGTTDTALISAAINDYHYVNNPFEQNAPSVTYGPFLTSEGGEPLAGNVVQGVITQDTTWRKTDGPVIVGGIVSVRQGATLTIEAGTEVRFQKGASLVVDGALNAEGTENDLIIFTSSEPAPEREDWQGIVIRNEAAGARTRLAYARIEYADTGLSSDGASPLVAHVSAVNNDTGFSAANGAPEMNHVTASGNRYGFRLSENASPVIVYSAVTNNEELGFFLYAGGEPTDSRPVVNRSAIHDNGCCNVYSGYFTAPGADPAMDFRENWWGTPEAAGIDSWIIDSRDGDAARRLVDYDSFLTETPLPPAQFTQAAESVFSPAMGGSLNLNLESIFAFDWTLEIRNRRGAVVQSVSETAAAAFSASWNGYDALERLLPDGTYTWELKAVDAARGLVVFSESGAVQIDTVPNENAASGSLISMTAADGMVHTYFDGTLLEAGKPGEYVFNGFEYDADGALTGGFLTYETGSQVYVSSGRVVWQESPQGSIFYFNEDGTLSELIDPAGGVTAFSYERDAAGTLLGVTAEGGGRTIRYDAAGALLQVIQANGDIINYQDGMIASLALQTGETLTYAHTANSETGGTRAALDSSGLDPELARPFPQVIEYDAEHQLISAEAGVLDADGNPEAVRILFEDGLPVAVVDGDGIETAYDYKTNPLGDFIGVAARRLGFSQEFDQEGNLIAIHLADAGEGISRFEVEAGEIDRILLSGGSAVDIDAYDLENGQIKDGTVTFPDGSTARYEAGLLVELTTPDGLSYQVTQAGDRLVADLAGGETPLGDTVTQFIYDQDMNLVELTRASREIVRFRDNQIDVVTPDCGGASSDPCEEPQYFYYEPDRTVVVQGPFSERPLLETLPGLSGASYSVSTYDLQGRPTGIKVVDQEKLTRVEFAYGKIRQVLDCDLAETVCEETFTYTYEFDDGGTETTAVTELETGIVRRYAGERLLSVTTPDNVITRYEHDGRNRVASSQMTWQGRVLDSFVYAYDDENDRTHITDQKGVTRIYDTGNVLAGIIQGNQEYKVHHFTETVFDEAAGEDVEVPRTAQELIRETNPEGIVFHYRMGEIIEIEYPDGTVVEEIIRETNGEIFSAVVTRPSGSTERIINGDFVEIVKPDGTIWEFEFGKLVMQSDVYGNLWTKTAEGAEMALSDLSFDELATTLSATDPGETSDFFKAKVISHDSDLVALEMPEGTQLIYRSGQLTKEIEAGTGHAREYDYADGVTLVRESGSTKYYDAQGKLFKFIDFKGIEYDVAPVSSDGTVIAYDFISSEQSVRLDLEGNIIEGPGADPGAFVDISFDFASPPVSIDQIEIQGTVTVAPRFSDRGGSRHSVTAYGDAFADTQNARFGRTSARLDGEGDYVAVDDSDDWYFGTGDFTIDFWMEFNSLGAGNELAVFSQETDPQTGMRFYFDPGDTTLHLTVEDHGIETIHYQWDWTPALNFWHHVALVREEGVFHLYLDGKESGSGFTSSEAIENYLGPLVIGARRSGYAYTDFFDGSIDEFRVSKGLARWSNDFTLRDEHAPDADTQLLLFQDDSAGNSRMRIVQSGAVEQFTGDTVEITESDGTYHQYFMGELRTAVDEAGGRKDYWREGTDIAVDDGGRTYYYDEAGVLKKFAYDDEQGSHVWEIDPVSQVYTKHVLSDPYGHLIFEEQYDLDGRVTYRKERGGELIGSDVQGQGGAFGGNAQVDPAEFKFGDGSVFFDGIDDYVRFPDSEDFDFSGRVWTMDFWIRVPDLSHTGILYRQEIAPGHFMQVSFQNTGRIHMFYENYFGWGGPATRYPVTAMTFENVIEEDRWHHVAIVQDGDLHKVFVDGRDQSAITSEDYYADQTIGNMTSPMQLGGNTGLSNESDSNAYDFHGWLDDFRISNGAVRWLADFSPPTEEAVWDDDTTLLLNFAKYEYVEENFSEPSTYLNPEDAPGSVNALPARLDLSILPLANQSYGGPLTIVETGGRYQLDLASQASGTPFHLNRLAADFDGAQTKAEEVVYSVFDGGDKLVYTRKMDGTLTEYENGQIRFVWDRYGFLVQSYEYDSEGNPVRITLHKMRDELPRKIEAARQKVAAEKAKALRLLAEQEQAAVIQIRDTFADARAKLQSERSNLEAQRYQTVCQKTLCWSRCERVENPGVSAAIGQIDQAIAELHQKEAAAYADLAQSVETARQNIETETEAAFLEIGLQERELKKSVIQQEISPLIFHYYRTNLGRDPTRREYDAWIEATDFDGEFDLARLIAVSSGREALAVTYTDTGVTVTLDYLAERAGRSASVAEIKRRVREFLDGYRAMTQAEREQTALDSLGLDTSIKGISLIPAAGQELDAVLEWLDARGLHFAQSAYAALEHLLAQGGAAYSDLSAQHPGFGREELAARLILIDIVTGVISPFEEGDLLISFFAMRTLAEYLGVDASGLQVDLSLLEAFYALNPGHKMIAHINENHYVIITNVFWALDPETGKMVRMVRYIDPGAGAGGDPSGLTEDETGHEVMEVTEAEFLKVWEGYVMTLAETESELTELHESDPNLNPNPPPRTLSVPEEQSIRGAFFFFLVPFFAFIFSAVSAAAATIVATVAAVASVVAAAISAVITAVGSIAAAVASAIQGAIVGIVSGLQAVAGTFLGFATTVLHAIPFIGPALSGVVGAVGNFALGFASGFITGFTSAVLGNGFLNFIVSAASLFSFAPGGFEGVLTKIGIPKKIAHYIGVGLNIAGAVATGNPAVIASTLASVAVQEAGPAIGLPPQLTAALSIAASALSGTVAGAGFDPDTTVFQALKDSAPKLASSFAMAGAVAAGDSLGLSWRLASVIGLSTSAIIGNLTDSLINPNGGGGPGGIFQTIKDALFNRTTLGGLVSIGAELLGDALDVNPLLISLGLRGLVGGIEGLTDRESDAGAIARFFTGVGGALKESLTNIVTLGGEHTTPAQKALYLSQLIDLAAKKGDGDIFDVFEIYATQILGRDTVESIFSTGQNISDYFKEKRVAGDYVVRTLEDGTVVHEYTVGNNKFVLNEDETQILARHFGNHIESGQYGIDTQGRYVLINGEMTFTDGSDTLTLTVRDAQVVSVDMTDAQGTDITFFGTQDQPLVLKSNPGSVFTIESGVVRNWDTSETSYYSNGGITAIQNTHFLDFQDSSGQLVSGSIQMAQHLNIEGQASGFEIYLDEGLRQELLNGNQTATQNFWDFALDNQQTDNLAEDHVSWLETFDIKRHELADNADAVVDKIFDFVKPETGSVLEEVLLFQQTASVELLRATIKGFIDVIRVGDRLDEIWNDATGAWKDVNDGNLSDAGKKLLSLGGNSFIELMRVMDLALIGGGVRSVLRSGATVLKTEVADFVRRLLRRTDDLAEPILNRLFKNSSFESKFLKETNNVDDVVELFNRDLIDAEDFAKVPFRRSADLDEIIEAAQIQNKLTGKKTTVLGHFSDTRNYLEKDNLNMLNFDDTGLTYEEIWDINRAWLDEAIQRGDDILLVTETPTQFRSDGNLTYYFRELEHLMANGYRRIGNHMKKITD